MNTVISTDKAAQRFITISIEKVIKLHEAGYTDQAIEQFADLLSVYSDNDEIIFKLATLYQCSDHKERAIPLLKGIPAHSPYYTDALCLLGIVLGATGDFAGGVACLTRLLELDASRVECYNNLALFLAEFGRFEEAREYLFKSILLAPDHADTYNLLGNLYLRFWRLKDASEQYRRVIEIEPGFASAYSNLAWIATLEGKIVESVTLSHAALTLQPGYRAAASNLLFTLNYADIYTPEQVRDEHLRLAYIYDTPAQLPVARQWHPGRKIRVGYVSGDFKTHSVAFFFESVLASHNKDCFDIFCYSMVSSPDETTQRMMTLCRQWRMVYGFSDRVVAELIRADDIDVLVDLAGHTEGNRLGVFAHKPAPVQVSWLGYPNTTGLSQMDYRLTDSLADPPGLTDHLYSERLVRLPRSFLCYTLPLSTPPVVTLPEGPIIFCCFNNYSKISDVTIKIWASILMNLPDSRLTIKNGSLRNAHICEQLLNRFAACGIKSFRLNIVAHSRTREEHLQHYGASHIALDTYPYNGTTTTCEALWMGVPVVTLAGLSHASRVGNSILTNAELSELIAISPDQYVSIVTDLARSKKRLQKYRQTLRAQLKNSTVMDSGSFTADLEHAYQRMLEQSSRNL